MSEWRDIATAPKDGREILMAYGYGLDAACPLVVSWSTRNGYWVIPGVEREILTNPTHWMELPAPPSEAA